MFSLGDLKLYNFFIETGEICYFFDEIIVKHEEFANFKQCFRNFPEYTQKSLRIALEVSL